MIRAFGGVGPHTRLSEIKFVPGRVTWGTEGRGDRISRVFVSSVGPFKIEAVVSEQLLSLLDLAQRGPITNIESCHIGGPHGPEVTINESPEVGSLGVFRADKPIPANLEHVDAFLFVTVLSFELGIGKAYAKVAFKKFAYPENLGREDPETREGGVALRGQPYRTHC